MSVPLSVTASAVGIISFGLTICGEIAAFGRAYRDYGEDIRNMTTKAESLCVPLKALREVIEETQITQPEMAVDLSEKAQSINASIMRLQDILKRYGPNNNPGGLADKANNQLKKAIHHFRKDTLREVGADLDRMQTILQTALAVYQWKNTIVISKEIQQMHLTLRKAMPPPSLLKDLCDANERHRALDSKGSLNSAIGSSVLVKQTKRTPKRNISIFNRWLGVMVTVSIGISTGAGGFSISPMLSMQIPVDDSGGEYEAFFQSCRLQNGCGDEEALLALQGHFTTGRLHPSLIFNDAVYPPQSLLDLLFQNSDYHPRETFPVKIVELLLSIGIISTGRLGPIYGNVNLAWSNFALHEGHVRLIERMADAGCNFNYDILEFTVHTKNNMKLILSKNDELIDFPEAVKVICREDATELKECIRQGRIMPKDRFFLRSQLSRNSYAPSELLDFAFGWVEGVEILLSSGASFERIFSPLLLFPGAENHCSAKVLLKAGCFFTKAELNESVHCHDQGERMRLLVDELASRRKKLRLLAEALLPSTMIPVDKASLLDGPEALEIFNLLSSHQGPSGVVIPPYYFFFPPFGRKGETVYGGLYEKQCAERLFNVGFRCSDKPDLHGNSPIGSLAIAFSCLTSRQLIDIIRWHISKGADLHRRLPWTNEPVGYLILVKTIESIPGLQQSYEPSNATIMDIDPEMHELGLIERYACSSPAPTVLNEFLCPCSSSKYTSLSAILREWTGEDFLNTWGYCDRVIFNHILNWEQLYWHDATAFIRSLTFNALDLTHSCFSNTKKGYILHRNEEPNNEDYLNDQCDDKQSLDEFEVLLEELNDKFDELGLPLGEFLSGYWYRRVKDHILTPQSPNEEHITGARELGVELEFSGLVVPKWIEVLFGTKVEEVGVGDED